MEDIRNPDSFIFYRSFLEAIEEADETSQLQLYRAISLYALNREEPKLKGMVKAVWMAIKPQIDANFKRYINGCKGAPHGKKGGAPKGNSNAKKQPQNNPKTTPNYNPNENYNLNDNADSVYPDAPRDIEEVKLFFREHCKAEDWESQAEEFYHSFEAVGWMSRDPNYNSETDEYDNGLPIKNWRAVASSWINNWSNKPGYREEIRKKDAKRFR